MNELDDNEGGREAEGVFLVLEDIETGVKDKILEALADAVDLGVPQHEASISEEHVSLVSDLCVFLSLCFLFVICRIEAVIWLLMLMCDLKNC